MGTTRTKVYINFYNTMLHSLPHIVIASNWSLALLVWFEPERLINPSLVPPKLWGPLVLNVHLLSVGGVVPTPQLTIRGKPHRFQK